MKALIVKDAEILECQECGGNHPRVTVVGNQFTCPQTHVKVNLYPSHITEAEPGGSA